MKRNDDRCGECVDAVVKNSKLLRAGDWTLGSDARYHWPRFHMGGRVSRPACDSGDVRLLRRAYARR